MSGTNTTDPCAGDGACAAPAEFVRLRYFFGQRLGVIDFADEQAYVVGKQRFHNARAHGAGVLCGLRAERYVFPQGLSPLPTTLLRVRRGAALDACGREIVVGWDQCIDVAAWYAQHPEAHPGGEAPESVRLWVALRYRECPSDPAPAPRDPCGCDAGGCEMARVREGFELMLLTDEQAEACKPAPGGQGDGDINAAESLDGSLERTLGRVVARLAGADCPDPPADPCLLLARFDATLGDGGAKVTDIGAPDNERPERLSLLPTSLLQQAAVMLLGAAGEAEQLGAGPRLGAVGFTGVDDQSGTLTVDIDERGAQLSRDPLASPAQLAITVSRWKDDGTWEAAPAFTAAYTTGSPPRLELQWAAGLVAGARYRALIQNDDATPAVDTRMRPLSPPRWARHFRLVKDAGGVLVLAPTLEL